MDLLHSDVPVHLYVCVRYIYIYILFTDAWGEVCMHVQETFIAALVYIEEIHHMLSTDSEARTNRHKSILDGTIQLAVPVHSSVVHAAILWPASRASARSVPTPLGGGLWRD